MLTILIIEDDPQTRQLLVDLVTLHGYAFHQAATAQTGIELAKTKQPNLILMDLALPGMNGLDAAQLLKQDPATQHIPIIAVTALLVETDRDLALAAGCDELIIKPFSGTDLVQKIRQLLNEVET